MTNPGTVCDCGHESNRHHNFEECDPVYKTTSRECMFKYDNNGYCECEKFQKLQKKKTHRCPDCKIKYECTADECDEPYWFQCNSCENKQYNREHTVCWP